MQTYFIYCFAWLMNTVEIQRWLDIPANCFSGLWDQLQRWTMDCFHKLFYFQGRRFFVWQWGGRRRNWTASKNSQKHCPSQTQVQLLALWSCIGKIWKYVFIRVTRNPWTCDPFTLGAYSYPTTRAKEGDQVRRWCKLMMDILLKPGSAGFPSSINKLPQTAACRGTYQVQLNLK